MRNNNKGIAIETALFMMVIVFALCTLLLTFALYSRNQSKVVNNQFESLLLTDQIGEDFYYSVKNNEPMDTGSYTGRSVTINEDENNNNKKTLIVIDSNTGKHLLTVVIEKNGTDINILRWSRFADQ